MANKCVRCGQIYEDWDNSILKGCKKCGGSFFMYIKNIEDIKKFEMIEKELEKKKTTLEDELKKETEKFGIETIRIPKDGVYEINVDALMKKEPLILLTKGETYFVYLPSVFEKFHE